MKKVKLLFLIFCALVGGTACKNQRNDVAVQQSNEVVSQETTSITTATVKGKTVETTQEKLTATPQPKDKEATIVSFGDTLCHSQIFKAVYNAKSNNYDFSPMFQYVKKHIKNATVSIGNLESSFGGAKRGYSGYPLFNAPEHLAVDLKELGVDVMTTANNHTLDRGFDGLKSTLDYLDKAGISHTGTARTPKEKNKILFKDLNGIKTAFLAFTYGTNGIPKPQGKEYCVNLIDKKLMKTQIEKAKKQGAEAIVVSMHWGVEYQTTQNAQQEALAKFLIKNDVNVILGSHPHVLQQMKMVSTKVKGKRKEGLVIYSQGNFFSAQTYPNTRNTAAFKVKLKKDGLTNKVSVGRASYIPIYVYDNRTYDKNRYKLLDLNAIIKDYRNKNKKGWSKAMYQLALTEKKRCQNIIGPFIDNSK